MARKRARLQPDPPSPARRRALAGAGACAGAWAGAGALAATGGLLPMPAIGQSRDPMATAMLNLIEAVPRGQRPRLVFGFEDRRRRDWHYIPRGRPGLALRDMAAPQRDLVWTLLAIALSDRGLTQVRGIVTLEGVLGELTGARSFRDPTNYAIAVFGDPAGRGPWGWRFEGHHLSLNFTVAPGQGVAVTPGFMGVNPETVPPRHHHHGGLRVMAREQDDAFRLLGSLSGTQRRQAILQADSFGDILTGPGREASLSRFQGVALSLLGDAQRNAAMALADLYIGRLANPAADRLRQRIRAAGAERIHFAWAGASGPGRPHYYRLHGPALLIEYDNTQNGANHAHSVLHDPSDGFGADLLRRHRERDH